MYKKILLPVDGSEASKKAAEKGISLAKLTGASTVALYIIPSPSPGDIWDVWTPSESDEAKRFRQKFEENLKCLADRYVSEIKRIADQQGVPCEGLTLRGDHPAEEIIRIAEQKGCDLIVMASHSRGGIGAVIGSVTLKVLSKARIPVLVMR